MDIRFPLFAQSPVLTIFIGMRNRALQWALSVLVGTGTTAFSATNTNSVVLPFKHERGHIMLGGRLWGAAHYVTMELQLEIRSEVSGR